MNTVERCNQAIYYKHNGYNCAQSILKVYNDLLNLDEDMLKRLGSGFGTGMGGAEATCGALIGANMVLGLLNKTDKVTKLISREMLKEFNELSHATLCKDLKGIETKVVLTSCEDCIANAIKILDSKLEELSK